MKKIIISAAMLFSTFMYSQEMKLMESMCKVKVWNDSTGEYERSSLYDSCYGFYMGVNKQDSLIIAIVDKGNGDDITYYKVYEEMDRKFLHWTYRAKDLSTGIECFIHHFRDGEFNSVRIDYNHYSILFIDDYWEEYGTEY